MLYFWRAHCATAANSPAAPPLAPCVLLVGSSASAWPHVFALSLLRLCLCATRYATQRRHASPDARRRVHSTLWRSRSMLISCATRAPPRSAPLCAAPTRPSPSPRLHSARRLVPSIALSVLCCVRCPLVSVHIALAYRRWPPSLSPSRATHTAHNAQRARIAAGHQHSRAAAATDTPYAMT